MASITENCRIKVAYKVNDPDTADTLARMSGKMLIDEEVRTVSEHPAFLEAKGADRVLRQGERCLIDTNMLQSLPERCAVLYGNGLADFIFTSPVSVKNSQAKTVAVKATPTTPQTTPSSKHTLAEDLLNVD